MNNHKTINITMKVWRQQSPEDRGRFETIPVEGVDTHSSFLEMLDFLNEKLILEDKEPIEFDNDCREGICGTCGMMVNGIPHGHGKGMTVCQLHMREFNDGDTIEISIPDRTINISISKNELEARRKKEMEKGNDAFKPVGRDRKASDALKAYALFASSADKGAVRVLPE